MAEPLNPLMQQVRNEVSARLGKDHVGHAMDHVDRVLSLATQIHGEAGGDAEVIQLAALLHDVGDAKFHDGKEMSGQLSAKILGKLEVDQETIDHVVRIVDNMSFRKRHEAEELSLEGQVVQDADRLDALGAIGIVRTIEYGAVKGQPFHDPSQDLSATGIGHFHEKLFRLRDLMNTEAAKQIAAQREAFMRQFVDQFLAECGEAQ